MPLKSGKSKEVIEKNIHEMQASGHPVKQSVAAALHKAYDEHMHQGLARYPTHVGHHEVTKATEGQYTAKDQHKAPKASPKGPSEKIVNSKEHAGHMPHSEKMGKDATHSAKPNHKNATSAKTRHNEKEAMKKDGGHGSKSVFANAQHLLQQKIRMMKPIA